MKNNKSTSFKPGENIVNFESDGVNLVGNLFLPQTYQSGDRLPGVVVTGSWTTVKEQMPNLYASKLAKKGFATLTFDFRFYGESAGEPRQYESPTHKITDIKNAFAFLSQLPLIKKEHMGAVSICASTGYMAHAIADIPQIAGYVAVAPWLHDATLVKQIYGGVNGVKEKIEAGKKAKETYEQTGEVDYVPAASNTDKTAAMYGDFTYYLDATRGAIPQWTNKFALMSWPEWLQFNPMPQAQKITMPTLFIHSEQAAIPEGAKRFFKDIPASKDFFWTQGTQFDFYDQEDLVNKAVALAALHFKNL